MEENKMKVLFNRVIPENYNDLQNMFKEVFQQDNIKNLTFDDGKEKINITEENYKNYVISAIELSHTTKNILVNVDQKKEDDKLEIKFNENLDLLKRKIKENNELKKKNKELEQKIEKFKDEEETRNKEINEEDKNEIIQELERKNKIIDQKCKILDGFEEFKKYMQEDKKYLDNLDKVQNDYKNNFESEIRKILDEIKNQLIEETRKKCEDEFNKYMSELENAENTRKTEYEKGLNSINYRMLIESSDLIHENYKCKHCKVSPIIGVLYKCASCKDYYLCEKCEEKNYHENKHPHNFIKIRKLEKKINDNDTKEDKKENQSQKNNNNQNQKNNNEQRNNNNYNPYQRNKNRNNPINNIENQKRNNNRNDNQNQKSNENSDVDDDDIDENNTQNPMLLNNINDNYLKSIMGKNMQNINQNNQMENIQKRNEIEYQRNEAYNKNLYCFECQFQNNGIYEFDLSKKIKPEITFRIKNNGNKDWKENETFLKTNKNSQLVINDYKLNALRRGEAKWINLNIPSINEISDGNYNIFLDFCVNNQIYGEPIKIVVKILPDEKLLKINQFRNIYALDEQTYPDEKIGNVLKKNKNNFEKAFNDLFN